MVVHSTTESKRDIVLGHAIASHARALGWDLLDLRFTRDQLPFGRMPQGALVDCLPTDPLAQQLRAMGCPVVRMGQLPHPDDDQMPAVLPDLAAAGAMAAEHFAHRGFRHMAYIGHTPWSNGRPLYDAFLERAKTLGCECHLLSLPSPQPKDGSNLYDVRTQLVTQWLDSLPKPIGVLGYKDSMAAKICTMCDFARLAVPEDVALLGYGNNQLDCEMAPVQLSSIDTSKDNYGRKAVQLLHHLMTGGTPPSAPVMIAPSRIIERRSTDVLAVTEPIVARAMRFMWDNIDLNLSVDQVARHTGVSRRKLERAFRAHLGRGINAELHRRRLERCCEMLRMTNLSITDLAPSLGFRSADYLYATFRRNFGITPRKYRLREQARDRARQDVQTSNKDSDTAVSV